MKTLAALTGMTALMLVLGASNAQTNSTAAAVSTAHGSNLDSNSIATAASVQATNALEQTDIYSDHFELTSKTHTAVYTGNVRVVDPRMKLTCDRLTGQMGDTTNRYRHVVAEGNVVIDAVDSDGKPVHATGGMAIYDYRVEGSVTNETVKLTINPRVVRGAESQTGEIIEWDRQRDIVHVKTSGQHFPASQSPFGGGGGTNKPISPPSLISPHK
jgi:lipopolysaccharide transport protein LptA